jgi:CRP/FNR family cyclic AMP-dependent transcriptional regulator
MRTVLYILGDLDDDDVEWLLATGERQRVPTGTAIIDEGRPPTALYLVLDGTLVVMTKAMHDGEVGRLGCGSLAGEMSFVDHLPPSATVRAVEETLVLAIPREALSDRLQNDSAFAARFYLAVARLLSERLRASNRLRADATQVQLDESIQEPDELDLTSMDTVYLAGQRFDRILRRLIGT